MREGIERLGVDMKYEEPKMDIVLLGQDMLIVTSGDGLTDDLTAEPEQNFGG